MCRSLKATLKRTRSKKGAGAQRQKGVAIRARVFGFAGARCDVGGIGVLLQESSQKTIYIDVLIGDLLRTILANFEKKRIFAPEIMGRIDGRLPCRRGS